MRTTCRIVILLSAVFLLCPSVFACMCAGVNPDIYPPDIEASRTYYRDKFKGAAFTGEVISSKAAEGVQREGRKLQEIVVEVDRYWLGVDKKTIKFFTPSDEFLGCWSPFRTGENYFFVPELETDYLYIGRCAYATFNRKADGNYVDLMVKMFGEGQKFKNDAQSTKRSPR